MTTRIVTISLNAWKRYWRRIEPASMYKLQGTWAFLLPQSVSPWNALNAAPLMI